MENWFQIFAIFFVILVSCLIRHVFIRRSHPPGPLGLPFAGILPLKIIEALFPGIFGKMSQETFFKEMKKKYGNIWSMEFWGHRIITLASLDTVKEAFIENAKLFSGRPSTETTRIMCEGCGIIFIDGELWESNKKLAMKAFRELGLGSQKLEKQICDEANELLKHLETTTSVPIRPSMVLVKGVSNVMTRLTFNEHNIYDDAEFEKIVEKFNYVLHSNITDRTLNIWPRFFHSRLGRKLFPKVDKFIKYNEDLINFVTEKCRKKIESQEKNQDPDCVFDYFWRYRYDSIPNSSEDLKFKNIVHTMIDLYGAGIDTTNNLLVYCCLLLGSHKDVQDDLRKEINRSTDDVYSINMDMRKECPKIQSFIDEVLRFAYVVPRLYHRSLEMCTFRGYEIRPDDLVVCDWSTIARDPILFDNPDAFNPYRFMDETRTKYIPSKALIPFGVSKRSCLGEKIAMMEAFLFLSRLILRFDILLPKETEENLEDILTGISGLIHAPLKFKIIFQIHTPSAN